MDAAALGLPAISVAEALAILRLHRFDEVGAPTYAGAGLARKARAQAVEEMPGRSPDRADAMVSALTDQMLGKPKAAPRVRMVSAASGPARRGGL